ncbi:hypothetical protein [Desulfoglaeba alkanexedens]|uniref:DUF5105 domain-containing protein n=1 Tax=Desulfoglaeba alkanexedens ALDC TaxID=980445 RepID=A0A4P8L3C1_9BACT|nr:hypothetical protein [Desulfoglaeba alkanexedens]QCQ21262.1 hypothetical protein FDQ92_03105 [Desulfoglaeba alkanexedens ALDC]
MLKKLILVSIIFLVSVSMLSCDKLSGPSPSEILNNYLDASLKGRFEEAYSYVSAEDKAIKDLHSYLKENEKEDNPFAQALVSKVSYKILKLDKSEKKASADVEITLPDLGSMFTDVMGAAFKSAFGGGDEKEMEKELAQKFESGEVPLTTKKETFQLVKEKDGWKVFLDWKTEKVKREKQTKIQTLLAEAEVLKESKKLHGAAQKYEEILELDSEIVDAKEGLQETQKEIKSFEEKQAYIENVVLYDIKAKYHKTYLEERVPGVEFKLKNKGNRTLNEVEVTVYFKDANGTIIAEEDYHPVLVTKYSFSGDNKPLKPNYIWQMEADHFYKAETVPTEWKEGAVSAKITNIEFAE